MFLSRSISFFKNIFVCIIQISFQKTFSVETFTNFKEVQKFLQSRILWLQCPCHGASEDSRGSHPKRRCPGSLSQGSFIFFKMTTSKVHLQLGEQSKVPGSNVWTVARMMDSFHAHFGQHKALLHSKLPNGLHVLNIFCSQHRSVGCVQRTVTAVSASLEQQRLAG